MNKILTHIPEYPKTWKLIWAQPAFKKKVVTALALNMPILFFFPHFFQYIEKRNGVQLNDILLNNIPAINLSVFTFIIIWSFALLMFIRALQDPGIFITFLFSFFALSMFRIVTIFLFPLQPPHNIIVLADPINYFFYGGSVVTKDLFYSGHTASQFLIFLCLKRRMDKMLAAISTIIVAIFLLVQHVHYSIDIIAAPLFAYISFLVGKYLSRQGK